jgi:hypothetical protein
VEEVLINLVTKSRSIMEENELLSSGRKVDGRLILKCVLQKYGVKGN